MFKKVLVIVFMVILIGGGCETKKMNTVDTQQKQIEELTKKIEQLEQAKESDNIIISQTELDKSSDSKMLETNSVADIGSKKELASTPVIEKIIIKEIIKKDIVPAPTIQPAVTPETSNSIAPLVISNIQAIPTSNGVKIRWSTSNPSNGYVTLWPVTTADGNYKMYSYNSYKVDHEVNSDIFLDSDKEFSYTINVSDQKGGKAATEERKFKTPIDKSAAIVTIEPLDLKDGNARFTITTDEPASVRLTFYTDFSRDVVKSESFYLKEANFPYVVSLDKGAFLPNQTKLYVKVVSVDDNGNTNLYLVPTYSYLLLNSSMKFLNKTY
jgi:hypothetical protein